MYTKKLKLERESKNLLQKDIAAIINIDRGHYGHYEREDEIISIKHLNTLCNYFNVSIDYIFSFTDIKQYKNKKVS